MQSSTGSHKSPIPPFEMSDPKPTTAPDEQKPKHQLQGRVHTYTHLKPLGAGCFGKVDKYRRESDGRFVAIKVGKSVGYEDRMLAAEAKVMVALKNPNIVPALEVFQASVPEEEGSDKMADKWHIVLLYCDTGDLEGAGELGLPLTWIHDEFFIGMLSALAVLERTTLPKRTKLHRDIKPDNILLRRVPDDDSYRIVPMLADWGSCGPTNVHSEPADYGSSWKAGMHNMLDPTWFAGMSEWRETPATDLFRIILVVAWLADLANFRGMVDYEAITTVEGARRIHDDVAACPELKPFDFLLRKPAPNEWCKCCQSERRAIRCRGMIYSGGHRMLFKTNGWSSGLIPTTAQVSDRYTIRERILSDKAAKEAAEGRAIESDSDGDDKSDDGSGASLNEAFANLHINDSR